MMLKYGQAEFDWELTQAKSQIKCLKEKTDPENKLKSTGCQTVYSCYNY